ncbi:MAG: biotin--protein ligase [Anaerolineaceae bacterium]|nr:biotin--protein ligase [Anaerolineaceae bacterium]
MQTGSAARKVPGGKLLRIDVTYTDKIQTVKLTGDFFLHPEETLEEITFALTGLTLPLDEAAALQKVKTVLINQEAQLIGATAEDIILTLQEALS